MADYVIPEPEPKEIDEKTSMELRHLAGNAVLKGKPSGAEKCENCRYFLEPYADLAYCWHPKLRILVGGRMVGARGGNAIPADSSGGVCSSNAGVFFSRRGAIRSNRIVKADGS